MEFEAFTAGELAAYLGAIPEVRALLGEHALPYAVVYDQFGTFVLLSTFGLYVLAKYGGDAPRPLTCRYCRGEHHLGRVCVCADRAAASTTISRSSLPAGARSPARRTLQ